MDQLFERDYARPDVTCSRGATPTDCAACRVRGISVCSALDSDDLIELGRLSRPCSFDARQMITLEGQTSAPVHNITGGVVRLYRMLDDGRRQILGFLFPGDVLGIEMAKEARVSAEAVSDTTACRFEADAFARLTARKPRLLAKLHERARHELDGARDHAVALGRRTAEERIGWFLVSLLGRSPVQPDKRPVIALPMSRQDIADHLGLTIETVSRTLTKLSREGAIAIEPHAVRVLDRNRLQRLAA